MNIRMGYGQTTSVTIDQALSQAITVDHNNFMSTADCICKAISNIQLSKEWKTFAN